MARVMISAAQKGGVGKTTFTLQGALATSVLLGSRTLLVDVDPQGNSSKSLLEPLQIAQNPNVVSSALYDSNSIISPLKGKYNIDVIPGDKGINEFPQELNGVKLQEMVVAFSLENHDVSANDIIGDVVGEQMASFVRHIQRYQEQYDYIWIDVPPSFLGLPLVSALCAATDVVGILEPTKFSNDVIEAFIEKVAEIRELYNPELAFHGFIINKLRATSEKHKSRAEEWRKEFPDFFLGTTVSVNSWIEDTSENGEPVWLNTSNSHRKKGSQSVLSALKEFIKELEVI